MMWPAGSYEQIWPVMYLMWPVIYSSIYNLLCTDKNCQYNMLMGQFCFPMWICYVPIWPDLHKYELLCTDLTYCALIWPVMYRYVQIRTVNTYWCDRLCVDVMLCTDRYGLICTNMNCYVPKLPIMYRYVLMWPVIYPYDVLCTDKTTLIWTVMYRYDLVCTDMICYALIWHDIHRYDLLCVIWRVVYWYDLLSMDVM